MPCREKAFLQTASIFDERLHSDDEKMQKMPFFG